MCTEQWSIHGNFCYGGLLRGSVVPAKFLARCMRKLRRSTRWLWYGLVDRARCVSRDVTLHRLSVLIRLVDNSPLDSRLHLNASHAKECLTHHPCIESVTVGCLCQCCTHKSSFTLSSYFAHEVSKLVTSLVRLYSLHEWETDGDVHWTSMGPKMRKAFQKARGQTISDSD